MLAASTIASLDRNFFIAILVLDPIFSKGLDLNQIHVVVYLYIHNKRNRETD